MRNKNCSIIKPTRKKAKTLPKPRARKSRTKTRKPKYISLKLHQLSSPHHQKPTKIMPFKQQLNLFPLHPENLVQDPNFINKDHIHDVEHVSDHVAFLFETATDTSTSLRDIIDSTTTTATTATSSEGGSPLSPNNSLSFAYIGHESEDRCCGGGGEGGGNVAGGGGVSSLIKTAMKCKDRDASEERWVSYWDVVEKKEQEEVSSSCYGAAGALEKLVEAQGDKVGLVGLKLDYQKILNAWSDKGPLFIKGESPQIVPDLLHSSSGAMEGRGSSIWRVPEMGKEKGWKMGQREASVLRYKEKRQSRLFSKRIRYQVRKLNADKRPRLKGRFVKRNGEE